MQANVETSDHDSRETGRVFANVLLFLPPFETLHHASHILSPSGVSVAQVFEASEPEKRQGQLKISVY